MVSTLTEVDRDKIFLLFALTESAGALKALDEIDALVQVRDEPQPGIVRLEWKSVFCQIRLALQFSASLSKIFWPQKSAEARGERLRALAALPDQHRLGNRQLRNHIEHMDERLDEWTAVSPRPYLSTDMILPADDRPDESRDSIINSCAVVYDVRINSVILFGDTFSLTEIREAIVEVQEKISKALTEARSAQDKKVES